MCFKESEEYNKINFAKQAILNTITAAGEPALISPKALIICGSGLGGIAKILKGKTIKIPYVDIPGFCQSTVPGHIGCLLFGRIGENMVPVVCMVGRLHYYEGYSFEQVTFPVRVAASMGIKEMIATNASGGVNETYKAGDLMVISDHINIPGLAGSHPLRGSNLSHFGPRFPAMSDAYDLELRILFFKAVRKLGINRTIHEGIYTYCCGPSFETTAECRMIRMLGGDSVGMSTVPEIIVARHAGMRCFGLSLITNSVLSTPPPSAKEAISKGLTAVEMLKNGDEKTSHAEVLREGQNASEDVNIIIEAFVNTL